MTGFASLDFRCYKKGMNEILFDPDPAAWDAYVATCPLGTFSHLHDWAGVLASTYDLQVFRLASQRDGRIAGLVPLILFAPPVEDKRLISLPYTDGAGIIADDASVAKELLGSALDLAADLGARHLELRQGGDRVFRLPEIAEGIAHTPYSFKTGLFRNLPPSSEELWEDLDAKVRNQVRKARNCGCSVEMGGGELLADFYRVFSENMRDLGSPVHAMELFQGMAEELKARVFVVRVEGTAAAAAIVFAKSATLFNPWASSVRRYRPRCPNMLLYWAMLAFGADGGYERFDFGRSTPGASTCRFKLQWGAKMVPLTWHVFSRAGSHWDPHKESLVDEAWKKLDLEDSHRRGPEVRRWISL
jgi:FemAB-related protein (PEP-CTERM system-associated)